MFIVENESIHTEKNDLKRKHALQRKNRIRLYIDIVMLLSFFLMLCTGIIKMPFLYMPLFDFFQKISYTKLSFIHDASGVIFSIAAGVHFIINIKRFLFLCKKKNRR